jgi:DNA-directed RNA polymerase I subunit RPA2
MKITPDSYDMEDAMILNKSAVDRGMFRGHIYQASYVSLVIYYNYL